MLKILNEDHPGIVKCRARTHQSVWLPGRSVHISQLVEGCSVCTQHRNAWNKPLLQHPYQEDHGNALTLIFSSGRKRMISLLLTSQYIKVTRFKVSTLVAVISALKEVLSQQGIPETVVSDNGPKYSSNLFENFATEYGFNHVTNTPFFSTSKQKSRVCGG